MLSAGPSWLSPPPRFSQAQGGSHLLGQPTPAGPSAPSSPPPPQSLPWSSHTPRPPPGALSSIVITTRAHRLNTPSDPQAPGICLHPPRIAVSIGRLCPQHSQGCPEYRCFDWQVGTPPLRQAGSLASGRGPAGLRQLRSRHWRGGKGSQGKCSESHPEWWGAAQGSAPPGALFFPPPPASVQDACGRGSAPLPLTPGGCFLRLLQARGATGRRGQWCCHTLPPPDTHPACPGRMLLQRPAP